MLRNRQPVEKNNEIINCGLVELIAEQSVIRRGMFDNGIEALKAMKCHYTGH